MAPYVSNVISRFQNFLSIRRLVIKGAKIARPNTITVHGLTEIYGRVSIDSNVTFNGTVKLADGIIIEQNCSLKDCSLGNNVHLRAGSIVEGCTIGEDSFVGPYAHIRPSTTIGERCQIGNFVEIKNSVIGDGSKINHLSYVGDTTMGADVIVGAGSVTCNFDGLETQETIIRDRAFIGSGTYLVAPVTVDVEATIGTGSVITDDVPAQKLTIARARQITVDKWRRLRPKTPS